MSDAKMFSDSIKARLERVKQAERAATIEECAKTLDDIANRFPVGIDKHDFYETAATHVRALPHDHSSVDAEVERAVKPLRELITKMLKYMSSDAEFGQQEYLDYRAVRDEAASALGRERK